MKAPMELVSELKTVRKGRGIFASQIGERVGPALRQLCDVSDEDGPAEIRRKVADRLENLADGLPEDLRLAVRAALGICPEARLPLYGDRVAWVATQLNRDARTARRRIDDGIHQLAQQSAIFRATSRLAPGPAAPVTPWHTTELRLAMALDRERPEIFEQRRVVSDRNDLTELDLAMTLPMPPEHPDPHASELEVDVLFGGTLINRGMQSSERHAFVLALPKPIAAGEPHDFALRLRLGKEQALQPYFVCVPRYPCDDFDLRVRFHPRRVPTRIWLLCNVFQRDVDDPVPGGETLSVDAAAEIHLTFRRLTPGLAYGVRWSA